MMYILLALLGVTVGLSRRVIIIVLALSAAASLLVKVAALDEGAISW